MVIVAPECSGDAADVDALLDAAFGSDRHHKRSYHYRHGTAPAAGLSLVAFDGAALVGTIRFWPVELAGEPALLLGPVAVAPARQGEGIGSRLIEAGLARAAAAGHRRVLLVGDPAYYARFGFEPATPMGIVMPFEPRPERLMARALVPGGLTGLAGPITRPQEGWLRSAA